MSEVSDYAPKREPDLADLSGVQLIEYCGQAAGYMRRYAASFEKLMREMVEENERLAADLETMAALAAKRNEMVARRARAAAFGIRDLHTAFSQPLSVDDPIDPVDEPAADILEPDVSQQSLDEITEGIRKIGRQFAPRAQPA